MYDVGYIKYPSTDKHHRIWMRDINEVTCCTTAHTIEDCAKLVFATVPQAQKVIVVINDDKFPYCAGHYNIVVLFDSYKPTPDQAAVLNRHIAQYYEVHYGSIELDTYAVYDKIN